MGSRGSVNYVTDLSSLVFCIIKTNQIVTCLFGLVHRHICPLEEIILAFVVGNKHNYADAYGAVMFDKCIHASRLLDG